MWRKAHRFLVFVALAALLTLPFLLPFHFLPLSSFIPEWYAALAALVAASLLLRGKLSVPPIAALPLLLCALALIQLLWQRTDYDLALITMAYLLLALLLMMVGQRLSAAGRRPQFSDAVAAALVIGAFLQALCGYLQWFDFSPFPWVYPMRQSPGFMYGNLAQSNLYADYLWLGLTALIYLGVRHKLSAWTVGVVACVLIPAALLSSARMVWIFVLIPLLAGWLWPSHEQTRSRWLNFSAFILALMLIWQGVLRFLPVQSSGSRLLGGAADGLRMELWRTAARIFSADPWLGAGVGLFPQQYFQHILEIPPQWRTGGAEHAHNIVMHLAAETGLIGLGIFFFTLGWWLWLFYRSSRNAATRHPQDASPLLIVSVLGILAAHSLLEYPLWYLFFLNLAALFFGMGSRGGYRVHSPALTRLVVAVCLLLGAQTLHEVWRDHNKLTELMAVRKEPLPVETTRELLLNINRGSLLRPWLYNALVTASDDSTDHLREKLMLCDMAERIYPVSSSIHQCLRYAALGGVDERIVREKFARAQAAFPNDSETIFNRWEQQGERFHLPYRLPDLSRLAADWRRKKGLIPLSATQSSAATAATVSPFSATPPASSSITATTPPHSTAH